MKRLTSSSRRSMRHATAAVAALSMLLGCGPGDEAGSDGEAGAPGGDGTMASSPEISVDPAEITFAPDLEVRLDAMTRYNDGLYMQTTEQGQGEGAAPGDTLALRFTMWLPDGTRVDSNVDHPDPMQVVFGESQLIQAWNRGLYGITPGEKRRLIAPPHLVHGNAGLGDVIPRDAVVIFDLTRVDGTDGTDAAGGSATPEG